MNTNHGMKRHGRLARRVTAIVAAMLAGLAGLTLGIAAAQADVTDQNVHDPGTLRIKKLVEGSQTQFAGNIDDLSGARFRVNWYKGIGYNSQDQLKGKTPDGTATWTTDKDGRINIKTQQPQGDDTGWVKKTPDGNALPLGTYTVVEETAPAGTKLSDATLSPMFRIVDAGDRNDGHTTGTIVWLPQPKPTSWNDTYKDIGSKDTDGTIVIPNHPKLTGVSVTKYDEETAASAPQGDATLEGVTYVITNQSKNPVYIREGAKGLLTEGKQSAPKQLAGSTDKANFYQYDPGAAIMRITTVKETDANGKAVYRAKTDDKVLPPGDYRITEEHTPLGYANAGWTRDFTYATTDPDGGTDGRPFTFDQSRDGDKDGDGGNYNKVWRGGLAVCKVDTDRQSGKALTEIVKDEAECSNAQASHNQGDGDLTGVEYTITNTSAAAVVIPQSEESSAWVTNKATVSTAKDGAKGWLVGPNQVIGVIRTKDLSGGKGTGPFIARTGRTDLPFGSYHIKETKQATGYHNTGEDDKPWEASVLVARDGTVDTAGKQQTHTLTNQDDIWRGGVDVVKADRELHESYEQGDANLEAHYLVYNESKQDVYVAGDANGVAAGWKTSSTDHPDKSAADGIKNDKSVVAHLVTKYDPATKRWYATTGRHYLPYGTYRIREVLPAPTGYVNDPFDRTFTIRKDGNIAPDDAEAYRHFTDKETWSEDHVQRGGVEVGKLAREHGRASR